MSVPVGKRGKGELQVLRMLNDLTLYTVRILRQEKVIPKSSRWVLSSWIAKECMTAYCCVRKANSIKVDAENEGYDTALKAYRKRRKKQKKAYRCLDSMLGLIDIAYNTFKIQDYIVQEWARLIVEAEDKLQAWIRSDKRRFTEMLEKAKTQEPAG